MKLLTFEHPTTGASHPGLLTADGAGVVDLRSRIDGLFDLDQLVQSKRVSDAAEFADVDADFALADLTLHRLFPWPRKIFCIGVNYGGRAAEYEDAADGTFPSVFVRFADSLVGHEQALVRPPESPQLDYEGEIVAVIGTGGRRIPRHQALSHLAGLSLGNEGTIRDWVRHAKFNVTQGKNWASSGAIGPWMVTLDEAGIETVADFEALELSATVNGELRQRDTPATMKYPIDYQISYLSTFNTLMPGDIIFTGTPTGAGARMDPPVWLEPGDQVEISVPQIGTLRNSIVDEFDPGDPAGQAIQPPQPQ